MMRATNPCAPHHLLQEGMALVPQDLLGELLALSSFPGAFHPSAKGARSGWQERWNRGLDSLLYKVAKVGKIIPFGLYCQG